MGVSNSYHCGMNLDRVMNGMYQVGSITQDQLVKALALSAILYRNGMPQRIIPMAITQILYETGGLHSAVDKADNNFTGIKWINKPYQKATRGTYSPSAKDYFAHFANYDAWAKDFIRILSLNRGGRGKPIDASNLQEYVTRLKANGYFDKSADAYKKGMATWAKVVIDALNKYKPEGYSNLQAILYAIFSIGSGIPGNLPAPITVAKDVATAAAAASEKVQQSGDWIERNSKYLKYGFLALLFVGVVNAIRPSN